MNDPSAISRITIAAIEPDGGSRADAGLLDLLDRLAPELDLQPRGPSRLGGGDHPVDRGLGELGRRLVERDRRERDRAVLGDRVDAGRIRAGDGGDVRKPADSFQ